MWHLQSQIQKSKDIPSAVERAYKALLEREDLGFFNTTQIEQSIEACKKIKDTFNSYRDLVVIGVGGSSLGAKALVDALGSSDKKPHIHFLDNIDAHSLEKWLNELSNPEKMGWVICSKSGGTIESLALYDFCSQFIKEKHNISITQSTVIVSEEKESLLVNFARKQNCPHLIVPENIGGRFSVFTPVGLLPALFCNLNLKGFLEGCQLALNSERFILEMVNELWSSHQRQERIFYSFQYCDRLSTWGLWLQQLWSESLGKSKTRSGGQAQSVATIVPCRGASDQHSVLQQIVDGPEKKFVCFHRVKESERGQVKLENTVFENSLLDGKSLGLLLGVQAESTEQAVRESQGGTMVLINETLSEKSMGALMMAWMLSVGVLGELLDINAFDQPGVESGKAITRRVLSQVD